MSLMDMNFILTVILSVAKNLLFAAEQPAITADSSPRSE